MKDYDDDEGADEFSLDGDRVSDTLTTSKVW